MEKVIVNDLAAWCGLSFFSQTQNPLYYAKHLYSDENTEITNLVIPESVTNIGNYTFSYCSGLTSVTIPNSVKSIGEGAFYCCESLTSATIPNSVKSIGNFAFNQCSSLNSVVIPEGVIIIGRCAFLQCKGLSSMIIPNSVTTIDESAFSGCTGLTSVTIGNGVMHIGGSAFSYCTGLTSVAIPSSVKSIGYDAFFGCGLNKIIVNDLAAWCGISFEKPDNNPLYYVRHLYSDEDTEIKDLIIPAGVTTISDYAFVYCSSFTSVTIPNSVTSIGNWAFQNCTGLTSVISLIKEPTSYGTNAFQNVSATLYVPNGQTAAYQNAGWNTFKNIVESGESAPVSIADASGLATYCPEVGVDFSNSADIAAYKASVDNNTVTLTRVYKVAAGEGVLIRSLNDNAVNDANVLIDIETTKSADNAFVGTLTAKTLSEKDGSITNFVLSKNKDGVVGFYKANNTPIAAGKAYLPVANYDAEAGARGLTLVFDDGNTTSISEIDNATTADNAVYTLSGARVKNATKGIYVKNGKKVVIK